MNKSGEEGVSFVGKIKNRILDKAEAKVIFCPPFTSLFSIVKTLNGTDFGVGAQNAHFEVEGAYTGEISVGMLKSAGAQYVIIGHSERRHIFGETDVWINKKIHAVLNAELVPIFCIGETLDDRKLNQTTLVLENQINQLENDEKVNYMKMIRLKETGLSMLIQKGYNVLELKTFFTSEPEETRAWTIQKNCSAQKAAGEIHTDFEKGFIKVETIAYDDFIKNQGWVNSRTNGKMRLEGKDYIVKDGDILNFRFNT